MGSTPDLASVIDAIKVNVVCAEQYGSTMAGRAALRRIERYETEGSLDAEGLTVLLRSMTTESKSVRARREAVDGYALCVRHLG